MLRAAVIGCGKIGSEFADDPRVPGIYTHAGAYAACAATELAGVCDVDPERAERCAARWGLTAPFTDAAALLDRLHPDLVSICTPDATHASLLELVLRTPGVRGVLAEKPLALDLDTAVQLSALAAERGVVLAVNYSRRYASGHRAARDLIAGGGIGRVQTLSGFYTKGVRHNGSHWFDLARWIAGAIASVESFPAAPAYGVDPTPDVRLQFVSGASAYLHGCAADAFTVFEMDVVATAGRVRFSEAGHRIDTYRTVPDPRYGGYTALQHESSRDGGLTDVLLAAVEDLVAAVDAGVAPRCTGADGVEALRIAAAAADSLASSSVVTLEECPIR
jgi:predicted dehydrogenase